MPRKHKHKQPEMPGGFVEAAQVAYRGKPVETFMLESFTRERDPENHHGGAGFCGGLTTLRITAREHASKLQHASTVTVRAYAERVLNHLAKFEAALDRDDVQAAGVEGIHLGLAYQWLCVCESEIMVRQAEQDYFFWHGITCKISPKEKTIVLFMTGETRRPIDQFVRACWNELYNTENRSKYDKAISLLNQKFSTQEPPIGVSFHIRGDEIIRENWPISYQPR